MSTYIYARCLSHDPPLRADDESGQHLYDLPQLCEDLLDRDSLIDEWDEGDGLTGRDDYFRRHTARFVARHMGCVLGIVDEYGTTYEVTP